MILLTVKCNFTAENAKQGRIVLKLVSLPIFLLGILEVWAFLAIQHR